MTMVRALCAVMAAAALCSSQTVNIGGTVTDAAGAPLAGAAVRLENGGQSAATAADGGFLLSGPAAVVMQNRGFVEHKLSATIRNCVLFVNALEKSSVVVTAYTIRGRAIAQVRQTLAAAGLQGVALPRSGAGIYLYEVRSGNSAFVIKSCSVGGTSQSIAGSSQVPSSIDVAKRTREAAGINDVIAVTKSGYLNYRVAVTNSDTSGVEIRMIVCNGTVSDTDGNVYQTVKLGSQVWTTENLRTTRFNDGTGIPHAAPLSEWAHCTTSAYCFVLNTTDADSIRKFGALYNWFAANAKKLAPAGWHVPDTAEWLMLQNYLIAHGYNWDGTATENRIAKSLAAQADWTTCALDGAVGNGLTKNNSTGFAALPGGLRYYDIDFSNMGQNAYWWAATPADNDHSYYCMLGNCNDFLNSYLSLNTCGFSVRLVKD
jgi:uncharacterized protein (TIGR02145 family)